MAVLLPIHAYAGCLYCEKQHEGHEDGISVDGKFGGGRFICQCLEGKYVAGSNSGTDVFRVRRSGTDSGLCRDYFTSGVRFAGDCGGVHNAAMLFGLPYGCQTEKIRVGSRAADSNH